ncbi:MAG: hypothetical protein WCV59_02735 [Parcubacteria group bacterium]|jgi:hypothetical protein
MSSVSARQRKWVLEKIVNNFENYPKISDRTWYKIDTQETDPLPETQRDIVEKVLEVFEAIKILSRKKSRNGAKANKNKTNWYDIKIISPGFDKLCEEHGIKFERRINKKDCHYISIKEDRTISLDDKYKLSKPNFESENDHFFNYVFCNPNRLIRRDEIEKNEKATIGKDFHHILNDLGFNNEIRKLFFEVSMNAVKFRNFIPKDKIEEFSIDPDKLAEGIAKLKNIDE